jgi:hypothetical protein
MRQKIEAEWQEKINEEKKKLMVEFERKKLEIAVEHEQELDLFQQQHALRMAAFRQEAEELKI